MATWSLRAKVTWAGIAFLAAATTATIAAVPHLRVGPAPATAADALVLVLLLAACVFFAARPLEVAPDRKVTASSAPVLALAVLYDPLWAVGAAAVAAIISQALAGIAWYAAVFNLSQRVLSVAAAGLMCHLLTADGGVPNSFPCVAAALVFFAVNTAAVAAMSAARRGESLFATWRSQIGRQWVGEAGLLAGGVLLAIHIRQSPLAVPLLLVPLWLAWRFLADSAEIRRLNASLRDTLERQRRFVADASHELRTPIASLRAQLDVLRGQVVRSPLGAAGEQLAAQLNEMAHETARMSTLLADLMALAHADAGAPLARTAVGLEDVLLDVYREARPLAGRVDFRLTLDDAAPVPPVVLGDRERLRQLFLNLVTNALRFTPEHGRVEVKCAVGADDAAVAVSDTGVGIPAVDLPRIFDRFYRVDRGRTREAPQAAGETHDVRGAEHLGGSGLGLAIAKWIAEAHEGEIDVQSEPGTGSTFTVRLPLAPAVVPAAEPVRAAAPAAPAGAR